MNDSARIDKFRIEDLDAQVSHLATDDDLLFDLYKELDEGDVVLVSAGTRDLAADIRDHFLDLARGEVAPFDALLYQHKKRHDLFLVAVFSGIEGIRDGRLCMRVIGPDRRPKGPWEWHPTDVPGEVLPREEGDG